MKNITVIPARKTAKGVPIASQRKLKVAAYCRVSTDSDEQANSYDAQIKYYTELIENNPEWELAGIFADEGISGTNTKKRDEFNRMIEECKAGNIDMVLTKSISRFARNTLDCLKYIRMLKEKDIAVYFQKENINTLDAKGEVMITIMASLAQQESESISKNVKLGIDFRNKQGKVQVNHNRFLGYTKDTDGHLIIDPEQAEVVKRIYREYLEGSSMDMICHGLEANGILTGAGNKKWHTSTIKRILTNEKYIGDALLQKTCTIDILNKTRVANDGIAPQYYVEDDHEAIIPKEIYMKVQEELVRRRNVQASPSGKKRMYSCTHCFSQMVVCGNCGEVFKRIHWNNHGCRSIVWRCASRLEQNGTVCNARTVNEKELEQAILKALNEMLGAKSTYKEQLQKNLMLVLRNDTTAQKDRIAERLLVLQQELLNRANNREAYDDVAEEIFHLRELQQQTDSDETTKAIQMERIKELQDFIGKQGNELTEFDEKLVKRWLRQITVWDDHYTVELKSGLSIDVPA